MKSKEFNIKVKEHLSKVLVKENIGFNKNEMIWINEKGSFRKVKHSHILHDELCSGFKNNKHSKFVYLSTYREKIVTLIKKEKIKLHTYQKHLNSSQNLTINFFAPLIIEQMEGSSKNIFGINNIKEIQIEAPMNDSGGGRSRSEIDSLLRDKEGRLHLFEIKYTESGFGKAKDEEKYKAKWKGTENKKHRLNLNKEKRVEYRRVTELFKENIDYNFFIKNYQLIRNLYNTFFHIKNGNIVKRDKLGSMNCVFSEKNETQNREFLNFKYKLLDKYQDIVRSHYWEDITDKSIKEFKEKNLLKEHYKKLKKIYIDI